MFTNIKEKLLFSSGEQRKNLMELVDQHQDTESTLLENTKLLDGLQKQLKEMSLDFKGLREGIRIYQKTQIEKKSIVPKELIFLVKEGKDKNQEMLSEIEKTEKSVYVKEVKERNAKLETNSVTQKEAIDLLKKPSNLNTKIKGSIQLENEMNNKPCSCSQHGCSLKSQEEKYNELLAEVKYSEGRQKDLLEDKQTEIKKSIADLTSIWSKKSQKLEENLMKLANNINTLKKSQNQQITEGMKKIKNNNRSTIADAVKQMQELCLNALKSLERKQETVYKDHSMIKKNVSVTKTDICCLQHENLNLQEKINSISSQLVNMQKEVEKERLRSRHFEEIMKKRITEEERVRQEGERKTKEWEERRGMWKTYAKHLKNQLETLEERLRHLSDENVQKVKIHDFEEVRKLQELLSERDAAISGIREALEYLISKVHDPFIAGIDL